MIVNIFTLIMLFIAVLSYTLGGYLFYPTLKTLLHFKKVVPLETKSKFERDVKLVKELSKKSGKKLARTKQRKTKPTKAASPTGLLTTFLIGLVTFLTMFPIDLNNPI